jgi:tRNA-dihydrouridine synthase
MVWIARGAIGNPWIFQQAERLLTDPGARIEPPTIFQQRDALLEHFHIAMEIHGESLAGRRMRKTGIKYSRFHPQAGEVKRHFIAVQSLRDWQAVLDRWYQTDGPGVEPDSAAADEVNDCQPVEMI